jgi:hypothetical protein
MGDNEQINARRKRLQALRERARAAPVFQEEGGGQDASPGSKGRIAQRLRQQLAGGNLSDGRKALARVVTNTLRRSSGPDTKIIPGTDYTDEGVGLLMERLEKRANGDGVGSNQAKRAVDFLKQPAGEGQQVVAGVNIAQLTKLVGLLSQEGAGGQQGGIMQRLAAARGGKRGGGANDTASGGDEGDLGATPGAGRGRPGAAARRARRLEARAESEASEDTPEAKEQPSGKGTRARRGQKKKAAGLRAAAASSARASTTKKAGEAEGKSKKGKDWVSEFAEEVEADQE